MNVNIELEKGFVTQLNKLKAKYGENFTHLAGISDDELNFNSFIDKFTEDNNELSDVSINPTSNAVRKDIISLTHNMSEPHQKLLALRKMYYEMSKKYSVSDANTWLELNWNGSLYLHDAPTSTFVPYCWAMSLRPIAERGLFFIDQFPTRAAKHLTTFCDHVLETISWMSNRQSGAVGVPDLLIYMYYFWNKDVKEGHYIKSPDYYARQCIQKVIYDMNQPYIRVLQSAFTNVSIMDREYLVGLFGGMDFPDGEPMMDHIENIIEFQKMFMEELHKTREEHTFTFPVVSYCLLYSDETKSFVDEEFARWCSDENSYWMDGNFYEGRDITTLSSCCRLTSDTSKLKGFVNSIGGTALSIGSCKVSTINLRRIALEVNKEFSKNDFNYERSLEDEKENMYLKILEEKAIVDLKCLDIQRGIIKRNIEKGLLPNYTYKLIELDKQYSTIGITGLYEALDEFGYIEEDAFGNRYYSDDALRFAKKILTRLNEVKDAWADKTDYSVNIENVPGESCNSKLAMMDNSLYPDCKPCYILGNQWIPLREKCTLQEKIRLGAELDGMCGGGQIAHLNIEGRFANKEMAWKLLNEIAAKGVIYFAFNSKIKECAENHHWVGGNKCPTCGGEIVEEFTRIVGFFRPVSAFSKERRREYKERTWTKLMDEEK